MFKKFIACLFFLCFFTFPNKSYSDFLDIFLDIFSSPDSNINFPYQNCDKKNQKYTELLTAHFQSIDINLTYRNLNPPAIPKQCFLAMSARGNRLFPENQYSSCMDENLESRGAVKLCINEDYVKMIQKAFTKISFCFDYDLKKQKKILQMINQESGSILNVHSPTGAKCLGQITEGFVEDINKIIESTQSDPLPYSEIYDEVVERCPDLENKVFKNLNKMLCKSIRDPYKCLFYTFFGFELSLRKIRNKLNSRTNRINEDLLSESEIGILSYYLPIKQNEMMNIILLSSTGEKKFLTFWDDLEVYETFKDYDDEQSFIFFIEKVPLFKKQENIEFMFAFWEYNGGLTISEKNMIPMIESLKQNISTNCDNQDLPESKVCSMRRKIQYGEGLSHEEVFDFFENDLLKSYPSKSERRRKQVAYYLEKMKETNKITFRYDEENSNEMLAYYEEAVRFKADNIQLKREEAIDFQKLVSKTCIDDIFLDF